MNEQRKENPARKVMDEKEAILKALRGQGLRITNQRKVVLEIILKNDCSCCKEIYYQAVKVDPKIGKSTIYRMIKTLEDMGAINRKNQYKVSIDETSDDERACGNDEGCMVILKNSKRIKLKSKEFNEALKVGLSSIGFVTDDEIDSIVI